MTSTDKQVAHCTGHGLCTQPAFPDLPPRSPPPPPHRDRHVFQGLPPEQTPDMFGLHDNAQISKDEWETAGLLDTLLLTQPRLHAGEGGDAGGDSAGELVVKVARDILGRLPDEFDTDACLQKWPITHLESMNTVLVQVCGPALPP